ncbi:uncharacterized protein LOC119662685 [Teleopsis dalmanni]|uniref:uncharacterized protein LOC119662685 n=1 Tax=Teleopsis dalmanni TaxID=139649 RepID=UPI0018CD728B|nr:uncharacterized protein LOC119662685 [Teleopsis dalmanni]
MDDITKTITSISNKLSSSSKQVSNLKKVPFCVSIFGEPKSGKTKFINTLMESVLKDSKCFTINMNPAAVTIPKNCEIDTRKFVCFEDIQMIYKISDLDANNFAILKIITEFPSVMQSIKRLGKSGYQWCLIEWSGFFDVFNMYSSSAMIFYLLSHFYPTAVVVLIDSSENTYPKEFLMNISNISLMITKIDLPFIMVLNKIDLRKDDRISRWVRNYCTFRKDFEADQDYARSPNSTYDALKFVIKKSKVASVSSITGQNFDLLFGLIQQRIEEYKKLCTKSYLKELDVKLESAKMVLLKETKRLASKKIRPIMNKPTIVRDAKLDEEMDLFVAPEVITPASSEDEWEISSETDSCSTEPDTSAKLTSQILAEFDSSNSSVMAIPPQSCMENPYPYMLVEMMDATSSAQTEDGIRRGILTIAQFLNFDFITAHIPDNLLEDVILFLLYALYDLNNKAAVKDILIKVSLKLMFKQRTAKIIAHAFSLFFQCASNDHELMERAIIKSGTIEKLLNLLRAETETTHNFCCVVLLIYIALSSLSTSLAKKIFNKELLKYIKNFLEIDNYVVSLYCLQLLRNFTELGCFYIRDILKAGVYNNVVQHVDYHKFYKKKDVGYEATCIIYDVIKCGIQSHIDFLLKVEVISTFMNILKINKQPRFLVKVLLCIYGMMCKYKKKSELDSYLQEHRVAEGVTPLLSHRSKNVKYVAKIIMTTFFRNYYMELSEVFAYIFEEKSELEKTRSKSIIKLGKNQNNDVEKRIIKKLISYGK